MNILHTWNVKELTSLHRHIMVSSVKLELTSTLDRFTIIDTLDIELPSNHSRDMVSFNDVTEEMCLEWTDNIFSKRKKDALIEKNEKILKNMYYEYYIKFIRKYSKDELPWNRSK
jgi:uncharacterized protein YnzC (UPF0291/DUF896 family)